MQRSLVFTAMLFACCVVQAATAADVRHDRDHDTGPGAPSPAADADTLFELVDTTHRDAPFAEKGRILRERYLAVYGNTDPRTLADAALSAMFESLDVVVFYSDDEVTARNLRSLSGELERRSVATAQQLESVHQALVAARLLDEARAFHDAHPGLKAQRVPDVADAAPGAGNGPPILTWNPERQVLVRENLDLAAEYQVLVVSHPLCRFSRAASDAIGSDPVLADVFLRHATWIVAPPGNLPLGPIEQWQASHRDHRIALVDQPASWRFIETNSTPTFYFLRAGEVVERISGWPEEGNQEAVVAALRRIGALPPR